MREMETLERKGQRSFAKPVKPTYRRSKSDLGDKNAKDALCSSQKAPNQQKPNGIKSNSHLFGENKKGIQPKSEAQNSLRKEIVQLERHLDDQQTVRGALEKALGPDPAPVTLSNESPILKPANQLIREVATLELEIKHLEQYLLTLYRKAFDQAATLPSSDVHREAPAPSKPSVSSRSAALVEETPKAKVTAGRGGDATLHYSCPPLSKRRNGTVDDCSPSTCPRKTMDSDHGLRSQSALSFRGVCSSRISPSEESLARALRSCHSQPFSFLEEGETATTSGVVSLADYLGTNVADHIPETPNNLSEEMVRCMAGVYCKLAEPPLVHHRASSSPTSSLSSTSVVSPQYLGDMWSPNCRREATLDSRLINPFHVEGLKEFSGPYNTMVEVPSISRDRRRLSEVEDLIQTYKLILHRLETADLRRMANEEKLSFWINVHNALLMHAYLKHGIPQNHLKKTSLLVKAECRIAGRTINAAAIQGLVLGCSTHHSPGQWLRTLLHPRIKSRVSKGGGQWQAFAISRPEPLLRFALCSGSHSDPAVRVYTPKRLFQQLEAAKEEYIRATVGVRPPEHQHRHRGRVVLPKLVEAYARDVGLSPERLLDAAQRCLPESVRAAVQRCRQQQQQHTAALVEWAPHRQSFRYLLARDLAFPHLS
uniref:Uncharacterized protein n=4 Tax=Avena sativa TaxID=4498 RepID=A0ACD5UXH8_AVESA